MKFVADESVDYPVVKMLIEKGHSVFYVAETEPGIDDDVVLKVANDKKSILITSDKDFGDLIFRQNLVSQGVILIRLEGLLNITKVKVLKEAIIKYLEDFKGAFVVISPGRVRIRPLKNQ